MRKSVQSFFGLAFGLSLRCVVCAYGVKEVNRPQPTVTQQRTFDGSGGGDAVSGRYSNIGDEKYVSSGGINSYNNANNGHDLFVPPRQLQNKITSNHLIRLEFNGVTYASMSLDLVKADLVGVVRDVLTTHLENGIQVVDVKRADNTRKLRESSSRKLSYIVLGVRISLRHSSWMSSEITLATTIDILGKYVDNDFRDYMRNLPGNGDYVGTVDVTDYYNDFSIGLPTTFTSNPITSPTQMTNWQTATTGSFQFELIFTGVSPNHANSEVLRNYIRYSITEILNDNLDSNIELVDVSLQPWLPTVSLQFPILVMLRFPTVRNDALAHADDVLSRNIGDIDLYLNDYLITSSLSDAEKLQLESMLKDIFGELASVEIDYENPKLPTQAPTKSIKPANDWLNVSVDNLEMQWWSWVILGVGLALVALCCCCCILQFMRLKRAREPSTVTNIVHVRKPDTEPVTVHHRATFERGHTRETMDAERYDFDENEPRNPAQVALYNPADLVLYEPNPSAQDPEGRMLEPQRKKKKKKKRKKHRDP